MPFQGNRKPYHCRFVINAGYSRYWTGFAVALSAAGVAFALYWVTLAPGLTWSYHGADGGDLLAAAVVNGVPHPTGYPVYTLLLQLWLLLWSITAPATEVAWRGNLFSACCGSIAVGITTHLAYRLSEKNLPAARPETGVPWRHALGALIVGLAVATAPQFWEQSLITEVYTLHMVWISLLAWLTLAYRPIRWTHKPVWIGLVLGLGLAHHFTIVLFLPAIIYWIWIEARGTEDLVTTALMMAVATVPGLLLYARLPIVAGAMPPPPVNWGYPNSIEGLWWTVSGDAYRHYLFAADRSLVLARISTWARIVSSQYTSLGFVLAMVGLYYLDRRRPKMRNFSLLWIVPVSLYSITYNTVDSEVYLLPVVWLIAFWLPDGLTAVKGWLSRLLPVPPPPMEKWILGLVLLAIVVLAGLRLPGLSLRQDDEAMSYLATTADTIEPDSLVFSSADAETFSLWYGAFASGELLQTAPGTTLINVALYQFEWYRQLVQDIYPDLQGTESVRRIIQENVDDRPIFFTEIVEPASSDQLIPAGPLWRYQP